MLSDSLEIYLKVGIASSILLMLVLGASCVAYVVNSWHNSNLITNAQVREINRRIELSGQPTTIIQQITPATNKIGK